MLRTKITITSDKLFKIDDISKIQLFINNNFRDIRGIKDIIIEQRTEGPKFNSVMLFPKAIKQ